MTLVQDILGALGHTRHGNTVANAHRKRPPSMSARLAGYVVGSRDSSGVGFIRSMKPVERHAELVYAESLLEKVRTVRLVPGYFRSLTCVRLFWASFTLETGLPSLKRRASLRPSRSEQYLIPCSLNLRAAMNIYRDLGKFLEAADAAAQARGLPEDPEIDAHFRSGVYLGVGASSLTMSLMPARLLTLVELFGYKGDRDAGLRYLERAGGWSKEKDEPAVSVGESILALL